MRSRAGLAKMLMIHTQGALLVGSQSQCRFVRSGPIQSSSRWQLAKT